MLTIEKLKEIDPSLKDLSADDISAIRNALYESAQLAFDLYWAKKYGSKYPEWLLTSEASGPTLNT